MQLAQKGQSTSLLKERKQRVYLKIHSSIISSICQEMYDILIFHPIPISYRYSSMSISNGIKLVAKLGKCLCNIQYRQNPWWGHTGTASTSHAAYRIDNRIFLHTATLMEMLWVSILEATNRINMPPETSCSKVQERESKCKAGSALFFNTTYRTTLSWGAHSF